MDVHLLNFENLKSRTRNFLSEILKILFFRMIKVDEISISPQSFQAPVRNKCIVYIHVVFLDSWISWFFDEFKIRFFGKCSESRTSDISKFFFEKKYSRTEGQFIQHTQGIDFYMSHSILYWTYLVLPIHNSRSI